MADELSKVRQVIATWVYDTLNAKFPTYFNIDTYQPIHGGAPKTAPNVYWASTMRDRPIDATECYIDVLGDISYTLGIDGEFFQDEDDDLYYNKQSEMHIITVNIAVTSMKNKSLSLSALQAQNLAYEACAHLRRTLKSSSTSEYFSYDNGVITPILVLSQMENISEIDDVSSFEETRNRQTNQFSCKFRYDVTENVLAQVATNAHVYLDYAGDAVEFDIVE